MAVMNTALQKQVIRKRLRSKGVQLRTVDLETLIDPTLSLPENIRNIEQQIQRQERRTTQAGAGAKRRKFAQREAQRRHDQRPRWDQRIDESKEADTVFADPTERQFQKWQEHPDRFDIEGVDTKKPREERQQAKNPGLVRRRGRRILGQEFDQALEEREFGRELAQTGENRDVKKAGKVLMRDAERQLNEIGSKMERLDKTDASELVKMDMDEVI